MQKFVKVQLYTDGKGEVYENQQKFQQDKFETVALPLYAIVDARGNVKSTFPGLTRNEQDLFNF